MMCFCIPEVREKENGGGKLSPLVVLTEKKCVLIHREICPHYYSETKQ